MVKSQDCQKEQQIIYQKSAEKSQLCAKVSNVSCSYRKLIEFRILMLLVLGLLLTSTVFYCATKGYEEEIVQTPATSSLLYDEDEYVGYSTQFLLEDDQNEENLYGHDHLSNLYHMFASNPSTCEQNFCKIACANLENLDVVIQNSSCSMINLVLLGNPHAPLAFLEQIWPPNTIDDIEVTILFNKMAHINNFDQNVLLFGKISELSLYNTNNIIIDSDALLGFKNLKHLKIRAHLNGLESAVLQPIQHSLVTLTLNCQVILKGTENPFEGVLLTGLGYLDLSFNSITGTLGKKFFASAPNVANLRIIQSEIRNIEQDAFENLVGKLQFLDLEKNYLTTLAAEVLAPILVDQLYTYINLADNHLICNCQLAKFQKLYKIYKYQFTKELYCKEPYRLFGLSLDKLNYELEETEPAKNTAAQYPEASITGKPTRFPDNLKINCSDEQEANDFKTQTSTSEAIYMKFPPPDYEFDVELIAANNSANVTILNPNETYLVIWFSEAQHHDIGYVKQNSEYECMSYASPNLIAGPLQTNTTYTFCVLSSLKYDISPFNCLPLYVPANSSENVWISEDHKYLTIGMLCLTFLLSTLSGAAIAYYGTKIYPNLLQDSRNGLLVKQSDAGYVRTISEIEYQKQTSRQTHKLGAKSQFITKLPLPPTPSPRTSSAPCCMSVKDLDRTFSANIIETNFEDTLPCYKFLSDGYETPKNYSDEHMVQQRSVDDTGCAMPGSPPALPKRNSEEN